MTASAAVSFLLEREIPFNLYSHTGKVESVEQAALERGQLVQQVIRSIVFRLDENQYIMVLIPGGSRIFWKSLRTYLGLNRISLATEEQVYQVTGYKIGTVSPFGVSHPLRLLIDSSIRNISSISLGSGNRGQAIILDSIHLISLFPLAEWGNFIE